jgi:predicted enzyme related to lactoylglutathione lyase
MSKNPVVHFEMGYEDRDRAADFYSKAFGWTMNKLGEDMGNYMVAWTAETDPETRMVKTPGTINGGMFKKTEGQPPSVVILVEDIRAAMKNVADAGGKVLGGRTGNGEPDEIPGVGLYASIVDTEGNRVGLMQSIRQG